MNEELIRYDLDRMWKHQLEIDNFLEIIKKLDEYKVHHTVSMFIYKLEQRIEELENEISLLQKYIKCDHSEVKTVSDGYDSHNDYYRDVCCKCGRTLRSF